MSRASRRRQERSRPSPDATTAPAPSTTPTATNGGSPSSTPLPQLLLQVAWWICVVVVLVLNHRATLHRITWYLAVDQFGYLTFASDLLQGKVFHDWPVATALAPLLSERTDMLAQTYVWDNGRMYCRYAPGFPIILATWIGTFGREAAHYLNPTLYIVFLCTYLTVAWRLLGDRWRGLVALCLILLLPTYTHLWALTLTRDLCAHLFGWLGLLCMLPWGTRPLSVRRVAAAGLCFGICACIRPDDIMYLIPAGLLAVTQWRRARTPLPVVGRAIGCGAATVLLGLLPFFGYNWIATGNPFVPTQAMELSMFLSSANEVQQDAPPPAANLPPTGGKVGYPSPGWKGGTHVQVQGGGLRLANLPRTLPALFNLLRNGYSAGFLGLAVWGIVLAVVQRPLLLFTVVPYATSALLLYGCWARPDGRYVLGVHYFMPILITEALFGTFDLHRRLAKTPAIGANVARWVGFLGAASLVAIALFTPTPTGYQNTTLPQLTNWLVPPVVAVGLGALFLWPTGTAPLPVVAALASVCGSWIAWRMTLPPTNVTGPTAFSLAIGLSAVAVLATMQYRARAAAWSACVLAVGLVAFTGIRMLDVVARPAAGFQRDEMERARATLQAHLPKNAVIITSEELGRPGENIEFYSGVAHGLYETDVKRWGISPINLVKQLAAGGLQPYWLVRTPETDFERAFVTVMSGYTRFEKVLDIPKERAMDWFVAASWHRGVPMQLYKASPRQKPGQTPPPPPAPPR